MDTQLFNELVDSIIEAGAIKQQEKVASRLTSTNVTREHLDNLEDLDQAELRYADFKAGRSDTNPLTDVMKRYGLKD